MNQEDRRGLRSAALRRPVLWGLASGLLLLATACTAIIDGKTLADQGGPLGGPSGGSSSTSNTGGSGSVILSNGGPKLRILTQTEYMNSLTDLVGGPINAKLDLPPDTFVSGFAAIGSAEVTINASAVEQYETASRTAAAEVFADATRWQKFVGCQPKDDLSDACVTTFVQTAGKRAFRRDLTDTEVQQWVQVGKDIAQAATSASLGLMAITTGLLQSPNFLYRVETNKLDPVSKRLKYDGRSMATRLSYLLTGHPPSDALLASAAAGQLDTADGVKTAAAALLNDPNNNQKLVERMATFFSEFSQAQLVSVVQKSPDLFPTFNADLQSSMLQATQLFIKNVVLAPGADVRSFFDSDQTFVDANLAPIYGVSPPASGFAQIKLGPETGRAGILGQAAVLAGHSQPDHNSPTRRGVFLLETFLCTTPNSPPAGVITTLPDDPSLTTRQKMEQHRKSPSCASCHALFDPYGFGLEHFDSIGRYRATEGTLPIDATGALDGVAFNGEAQMGAVFRQSSKVMTCMMNNFYRNANGVLDPSADSDQIDALTKALDSKHYVWRDFVADFVASDAFRSAPAAVPAGN
jgi:hypothetical protein